MTGRIAVEYECGGGIFHHHIVTPAGITWMPGRAPEPTIRLLGPPGSGLEVPSPESADDWRMEVPGVDGHCRIPPLDVREVDWSDAPRLPDVDLLWRHVHRSWPFGVLHVLDVVRDGIPVCSRIDETTPCDVMFVFAHERSIRFRTGTLGAAEVVAPPSEIAGELDAALLVAGLIESKAYLERWRMPESIAESWLSVVEALGDRTLVLPTEARLDQP